MSIKKSESVGERIRNRREYLGMTQEELSQKANISRSALANYESGIREPKGVILKRLAEALETTTDYLLGCTTDPNEKGTESWWYRDTPPTRVELEEFLRNAKIYFHGAPLDEEDKEDIITYLQVKWEREKRKREKEKQRQKGK